MEESVKTLDHKAKQDPKARPWYLHPLVIGAAVVVIAIAAWLTFFNGSSDDADASGQIRAVRAETRDLVEFTTLSGTLNFSDIVSASASGAGVITEIVADGTSLNQGDTIYRVNDQPIVLLYGNAALFRNFGNGDTGDDVLLLEQNLASLGFNVDSDGSPTDFIVDGTFTATTADALARFQDSVGLTSTGSFNVSDYVVAGGPSVASNISVRTGTSVTPGMSILDLNVDRSINGLFTAHSGVIESTLEAGSEISSGDVVYVQDGLPITAFVTDEPFTRTLTEGVTNGADVAVLEQALADLGFDADGELTVDESFTSVTTEAISEWQQDLSETWSAVEVTGELALSDLLVVSPDFVRIDTVSIEEPVTLGLASQVYTLNSAAGDRIVEANIAAADRSLVAIGNVIDVEFPDGTVVDGTVISLATSAAPGNGDGDGGIPLEVAVSETPESARGLTELAVDLNITNNTAEGVIAVPVGALIAQGDGIFAVETTDGETTEIVTVEPGLFAEGFVEVTGIEDGTAVVVPS